MFNFDCKAAIETWLSSQIYFTKTSIAYTASADTSVLQFCNRKKVQELKS